MIHKINIEKKYWCNKTIHSTQLNFPILLQWANPRFRSCTWLIRNTNWCTSMEIYICQNSLSHLEESKKPVIFHICFLRIISSLFYALAPTCLRACRRMALPGKAPSQTQVRKYQVWKKEKKRKQHTSIVVVVVSIPVWWWSWWRSIFHLFRRPPFSQCFSRLTVMPICKTLHRPHPYSLFTNNTRHLPLKRNSFVQNPLLSSHWMMQNTNKCQNQATQKQGKLT